MKDNPSFEEEIMLQWEPLPPPPLVPILYRLCAFEMAAHYKRWTWASVRLPKNACFAGYVDIGSLK